MVYVDTSIIVAYYCPEPLSERAEAFLTAHIRPAISNLTEVEFFSALSRKVREGGMARKAAVQISSKFLAHLQGHFFAYFPVERRHYTLGREWLGLFSTRLRTLDSLHLAVAFSEGLPLSTADHDLYESARYLHIEAALLE
jgi:uncharacterized protein